MSQKISAPVVTVLMDDGQQHDVKLAYQSQLQYSRTARLRKWPSAEEAPVLAINFMTWFTMCQLLGIYTYTLEEFEEHVEWLAQKEDEELTEADPEYPINRATSDAL